MLENAVLKNRKKNYAANDSIQKTSQFNSGKKSNLELNREEKNKYNCETCDAANIRIHIKRLGKRKKN